MNEIKIYAGNLGYDMVRFYDQLSVGEIYIIVKGNRWHIICRKESAMYMEVFYNIEETKRLAYLIQEYS